MRYGCDELAGQRERPDLARLVECEKHLETVWHLGDPHVSDQPVLEPVRALDVRSHHRVAQGDTVDVVLGIQDGAKIDRLAGVDDDAGLSRRYSSNAPR